MALGYTRCSRSRTTANTASVVVIECAGIVSGLGKFRVWCALTVFELTAVMSFLQPCVEQDSSTQGLKVTAIDNEMNSVYHSAVNFDKDLPQYGTQGGFHEHNHDRVTAPTLMFADALDMLLSNMKNDDFNFAEVSEISYMYIFY